MFDLLPFVVLNTIPSLQIPFHEFSFADSLFAVPQTAIASTLAQTAIISALAYLPSYLLLAHLPTYPPCANLLAQLWLSSPVIPVGSILIAKLPRSCPAIHFWCKLYCTTLPAIRPWSNILTRLCQRSTLSQKLLHNLPLTFWQVIFDQSVIARLAPDRSTLCLSISLTFLTHLSFVFSRWALPFALEVIVIGDQLTSLEAAPFTLSL